VPRAPRILYLARHGETDWNAAGRWQGHTDVPLNDTGRQQARALAEALRPHGVHVAVSSDLSRARETAQIVAQTLGVPLGHADPDLRERGFGVFEGLTRAECETQHPEAWRAWLERRLTPGGAETQQALAARVVAAATRVALQLATRGDDAAALVVTHGGALRALVEAVTGTMPPFVKNGQVWRVSYVAGERFVDARPVG
jgi:probable phosphoglycerate mutase